MEFKAKKSLGQNFLKSKSALSSIIKAGDIKTTDTIIEVGPGKGVLTEGLLEKAGRVIAIEKDDRLIELLEEKFKEEIESGKFQIIHKDILEVELGEFGIKTGEYKLVANIPYYITGLLFRKFLESECQPERIVVMVQKEVAKRIVARDGKESILSLSVKAYGEPKYIETVPARYFSPAPKVDSAILLIQDISKKNFKESNVSELHFFEVVKAGLAHKRKVLIRNLEEKFSKETVSQALISTGVNEKARGEDLSLSLWMKIASRIN